MTLETLIIIVVALTIGAAADDWLQSEKGKVMVTSVGIGLLVFVLAVLYIVCFRPYL